MNYTQKTNSSVISAFAYLLVVAPVVLCLWYVSHFGVDIPFWDEWGFVELLKGVYGGTTSWLDILGTLSGEHLIGVPYLLMVWLAKCTHYNVRAEMFVNWFFLVLTWVLFLKITRERLPNGLSYIIALIPISWLVCSLRQYETLLMGLLVPTPISIFFLVLSLYLLDWINKSKYWFLFLGLAIFSGVCSTLSFVNGLLIWPLGALQLSLKHMWSKDTERSYKPIIIWLISVLIISLIIFFCYEQSERAYLGTCPYGLAPIFSNHHYWEIVSWFITYLVSPVIPTFNDNIANSYPDIVVFQGLAICGIYAAVIVLALHQAKELRIKLVLPFIFIAFAVASDCLTILARVGGGVNQALASRYTPISYLGIVGAYLILLIINKPSLLKVRAFLLGALLVPVFASMIMCTKVGIEEGRRVWVQRTLLSYVVLSYKQQDPRLFSMESLRLPANFIEVATFLEANHLSVFRKPHLNLHIPKIQVDSMR